MAEINNINSSNLLSEYAAFLKKNHLEDLAKLNRSLSMKLDIPIMKIYSHMSAQEWLKKTVGSFRELLGLMEKQEDIEKSQSLFHWELNEMPELNKKNVDAVDLIRLYYSQEQTLKEFIRKFTKDQLLIGVLSTELDKYYVTALERSFNILMPLRMSPIEEEQTELGRANETLKNFSSMVAHDLREPLRMISQYVKLLEKRYKGKLDKDADEFIHYAVDGAKRMDEMIGALLKYAKENRLPKIEGEVNMETILKKKVLLNLQKLIDENEAKITHDKLPSLKVDENDMIQLFQNLIFNALRYRSGRKPEIHIGFDKIDNECTFTVRDNGIGIPKKDYDNIFKIFHRSSKPSLTTGTGIGLSICKSIVERYDGHIWVESKQGKGTTFFFTLPLS